MFIQPGSADQSIDVLILDSSETDGSELTGLAHNTSGLTCHYRRGPTGAATAISLASQTVGGSHTDGGFAEIDSTNMPGQYRLDLPDAAVAAGVDYVTVTLRGAANMVSSVTRIELNERDANVANWRGTQPNALVSNRVDVSVGAMAADTITETAIEDEALTANKIAENALAEAKFADGFLTAAKIATDALTADKIDSTFGAEIAALVESYIVNEGDATAVMQAIADVIAQDWIAGDAAPLAIVAALKADAEWSNLATLAGNVSSVLADTAAMQPLLDVLVYDMGTVDGAPTVGGSTTDIVVNGANIPTTSVFGKGSQIIIVRDDDSTKRQACVVTNLQDDTPTGRVTITVPNPCIATADDLVYLVMPRMVVAETPGQETLRIGSTGRVGIDWSDIANATATNDFSGTTIGTVTTNTDTAATLGSPAGADFAADVAAIKTVVDSVLQDTETDGVALSTATIQAIGTAFLDLANGVENGFTVRQALRIVLAALAGKSSGQSSNAPVIRDVNDTKNRISATTSADGRSAVTLDAT